MSRSPGAAAAARRRRGPSGAAVVTGRARPRAPGAHEIAAGWRGCAAAARSRGLRQAEQLPEEEPDALLAARAFHEQQALVALILEPLRLGRGHIREGLGRRMSAPGTPHQ